MDLKKEFEIDPKKENEGVWQDFGDGTELLIARAGNKKYKRKFRNLSKPYMRGGRLNNVSDEKAGIVISKALAGTVLLDWKGIEEDGEPVEFSIENAANLMIKYPDFRIQIEEVAGDMSLYKVHDDEEKEKNFEPSSDGGQE